MGQDKGGNVGKNKRKRHDKVRVALLAGAVHNRPRRHEEGGGEWRIEVLFFACERASARGQVADKRTVQPRDHFEPKPKASGSFQRPPADPCGGRWRSLVLVVAGHLSGTHAFAIGIWFAHPSQPLCCDAAMYGCQRQGGRNIVATCYDSKREVKEKYTNSLLNADALETAGAQVHFDVDGTALEKETWIQTAEKFQAIVFNFPHLGGATEDDVVKNQHLLRNFFYSTRPYLHPTRGQVLVSLRNTLFYNRWRIQEQAQISGFKLKKVEPFDGSMYSGYEPQRTHPASFRGEPPSTTGAHYYIFAIDGTLTPEDPRLASSADSDDDGAKATLAAKVHGQKASKKDKPQQDAESLECKVCATRFRDLKKYNAHINSAKHARKVKAQKKR